MTQITKEFKHESLQDSETIQEILKSITRGISEDRLQFSDELGEIAMEPHGLLNLKITASQENNRHKFNLRVSWKIEDENVDTGKNLKILSHTDV